MTRHTPSKRSAHELKRLVEAAVEAACDLKGRGLWFCVEEVLASGQPTERLTVWATLHFMPTDHPFCCGEPECHLGLRKRRQDINDHVRRAMKLRQVVSVEFGNVSANYHDGIRFTSISQS